MLAPLATTMSLHPAYLAAYVMNIILSTVMWAVRQQRRQSDAGVVVLLQACGPGLTGKLQASVTGTKRARRAQIKYNHSEQGDALYLWALLYSLGAAGAVHHRTVNRMAQPRHWHLQAT